MIKALLLTTFFYGLLPLLLGYAIASLVKRHISLPVAYVTGYVVYFALFEILTIWESRYASYTRLSSKWKLMICIITVLVIAGVIYGFINTYRKGNGFSLKVSRKATITVVLTLFLVLSAVLFLIPHALDDTPELARLSIAKDSFYSIDASSEPAYADKCISPGYLYLFYAFGSTLTNLDVTTFIHILLPIFMIPFFVCSYTMIANILFPEEEPSRDRFHFVWLILLFYTLMVPLEGHIAFAPYRNIWNGVTLAASCLLPLFVIICIKLIQLFTANSSFTGSALLNSLIGLICLALSIRLCISHGLILCGLFILATIILILANLIRQKLLKQNSVSDIKGGDHS